MKKVLFLGLLLLAPWAEATITQVQSKHTYPATSGSGVAFASNNTAANLLIVSVKGTNATAYSISDTVGNTWSSFAFHGGGNGTTNLDTMKIFYVLSCKSGANTVTITDTGGNDMGFTMLEYSASGGATWSVDSSLSSGLFTDGSGAGTTAQVSTAFSTAGADDLIYISQSDEANTQATHTPTPGSLTEIQWDNGHVDADAEWLDATAQTNITPGWNVATAQQTWCLYAAAFTASSSGSSPAISPSNPVVNQGATLQFTSVDQGSWTCVGTTSTGSLTTCAGSINLTTGLYTAPSSVTAQHVYGGMQIGPNNNVYHVRIDSMPVHANNAALLAAATQYGGSPNWQNDFPINYVNPASPIKTMNFHYTPLNNGPFETPQFPTARAEHGWFSALQGSGEDHHVITADTVTLTLSDRYQYYPACTATAASVTGNVATITCSEDPSANQFSVGMLVTVGSFTGADTYFNVASVALTAVTSTSISYALTHANASASTLGSASKLTTDTTGKMNSASGIIYATTDYAVPANNATDAAGMKLQYMILNLQEIERAVALNGDINHAFRNTFALLSLASSFVWPGTTFATDGGTIPFGSRLRLKGSYDISSFSSIAQIYLRALKRYGTFAVDGGNNWPMNAEVTRWPKAYYDALTEVANANLGTQMEFVDESSIMISTDSEKTTLNREIIKFTRTSDVAVSTVDVILNGPAVSFEKDAQYIMAGTPATQLSVLNNYGGFTCSMSPTVGSITSGCLYTAPSTVVTATTTTITATSLVNSSATAVMAITVFPSTGIYVIPSQSSNYTDSTGITWNAATGTYWPDTQGCCSCDNQASFAAATDNTLWKCYVSPTFQGGDAHLDFIVPNGTYRVLYRYGTQQAIGNQFLKLTVGSTEIYSDVDPSASAGGQFKLFASTTTAVFNNQLSVGVWTMNDAGGPISSLSIEPSTSSTNNTNITFRGRQTFRGRDAIK